jgi:hypothetical protein
MLTHWMAVYCNGQTVRFKYMRKDDFAKALNMKRFEELKEIWKTIGPLEQWQAPNRTKVERELRKFEQLNSYQNKQHKDIEELKYGRGVLILYQCFRRAKEAAGLSVRAFKDLAGKWPNVSKTGAIRIDHPMLPLLMQVLDEYFAQAHTGPHIEEIAATFAKTAQGLNSNDLTISDCLGRERTGPEQAPAEGIVPLRKEAHNQLEEETKSLDEVYEKRAKKLEKMMGDESGSKELEQQQQIDQQYLMRKYLASGETNSIHIEYSFIDKYSIDAMARIILHEATHKFAATGDFGYADRKQISKLRPDEAIRNADSFAYAGISILRNTLITPAQLNTEKPAAIDQSGIEAMLQAQVMVGKGVKSKSAGK